VLFREGALAIAPQVALQGVFVALATPADESGAVDTGGLERLVQRVISGGVSGISPVGSTGEGPRLTRDQRVAVVRRVRALAPPAMPVVPGVPFITAGQVVEELNALAGAGASAALVSPPSYYPLSDPAVQRLYEELADRSPLPLLLYNIPVFTKVRIAPAVAAALAAHPRVAGLKDSSRDMEYQQQVIRACAGADFSVLTGTDSLLVASLLTGAHGTIAASANLAPQLVVGVYRSFLAGDMPGALRQQEVLSAVVATCRRGEFPAGWKAALEIAGVCAAHVIPPGSALSAAERAGLAASLDAAWPGRGIRG
jgi:4-hydroxy-tetrahydrodipicolinate synthase